MSESPRAPAADAAPRTFLLGMGVQKAGTSWLHAQLARQPFADFGPLKEYHVLDAAHLPSCRRYLVTRTQAAAAALRRAAGGEAGHVQLRRSLQRSLDRYVAHFAELLDAPGVRLTGDLTPSHSGLGASVLAAVRDAFGRRGVAVKAVLLLRDPVERCWSAVRMIDRKRDGSAADATGEADRLRAYFRTENAVFRTDYASIASRTRSVFPGDAAHVALYEEMTTPHEIARLGDFVGGALRIDDPGTRVNASPKQAEIPDDLADEVARFYAEAYAFARREFGAARIDRLWPHARRVP